MNLRRFFFLFQRIRHQRDRFKRQQGAHLYLPGAYVTNSESNEEYGPWGPWGTPSQCSRTCGGGVSTQARVCLQDNACQGPDRKYFSCNTQVIIIEFNLV